MAKVDPVDLTAEQVESIEADFGPIDEWGDARSKAALLVRILSVHSGEPVEQLRKLRMRDLMDRVRLGGDDDANPTPPSEP